VSYWSFVSVLLCTQEDRLLIEESSTDTCAVCITIQAIVRSAQYFKLLCRISASAAKSVSVHLHIALF
jgi:hypothetical protein